MWRSPGLGRSPRCGAEGAARRPRPPPRQRRAQSTVAGVPGPRGLNLPTRNARRDRLGHPRQPAGLPLTEFSRGAALAAEWTRNHIEDRNLQFLEELEPADVHQSVGLYHASPRDPVWEYVLSSLQADLCLDAQRHRVCLIGHSHVALAFGRDEGSPISGEIRGAGAELDVSSGEWLLNPGSVGQPRDGDPRAAWLVLDTDAWVARWRRVPYDIGAAASAIRAAKLPESLDERLHFG